VAQWLKLLLMNRGRLSRCRALAAAWLACFLPFLSCAAAEVDARKKPAGDDLFRDGALARIRIEIPAEGMNALRQYSWKWGGNEDERVTVRGTIREGASTYTNVAIRLKGAAGSFRRIDQNPGLTLNFDKFADGQRFHGLQKISLNNSVQDASFVSDKFSRELFAKVGVPVPRAGHARVELNGRDLGLYVLTEGWNKQFLKRHFKNTTGNLYDCGFAKDIGPSIHINSGDEPEDRSDVEQLVAAAKKTTSSKKLDTLASVLDVDRFANLIALDALLWNWDGYMLGHNNYRVFHDKDAGKMIFMPHGLDQLFWRPDGPIMPGGKGIVARAYLGTDEGRQKHMDAVRKIMAEFFDSTTLTDRVREISASLRPALQELGSPARKRQEAGVEQLCRLIILRVGSLQSQLFGSSNLLTLKVGQSVALTNWNGGEMIDNQLHLTGSGASSPASSTTTVWLEAGYYRVEGRVKTRGVVAQSGDTASGAGFRVVSKRKPTEGTSWDFFPFRESGDVEKRAEMLAPGGQHDRVTGVSDWKQIRYDFDLRQPMADLQVLCELRARKGEAWFDPTSVRLVRRNPPPKAKAE
jgi:spore coat protein H